jgi:homoserine kinase
LSTKESREVLPKEVTRKQAVANIGRAGLMISALAQKRYDLLATAIEDQLHVPFRKNLIPGYDAVVAAAKSAGAYGATISGAGPSILAFAKPNQAEKIGQAMSDVFSRNSVASLWLVLKADLKGARVLSSSK